MTFAPLFDAATQTRLEAALATEQLDRQLVDQPREVRFCKRCVVSNQRPRITFDVDGVCSACRFAERKDRDIDWRAREAQLIALLDQHRSRNGGYDCIVPCSGGKDSAYVAHVLKAKYGMHPLTVTWAPFIYTDIGRQNMERFIHAGFDNITATPDGIMHRKLARLAFDFLGDPFQPFVYGQLNFALHAAARFRAPLVFFGENGEAEYGGSVIAADRPCFDWADFEVVYLKGAGVDRLIKRGTDVGAFTPDEAGQMSPYYRMPMTRELLDSGTQFHWMSYYRRWTPQENYYYATEHTGFEPNPERNEGTYSKYASIDDRLDGLHYYMAFIKFGIGRCTSDAAHEIRDRHISREEAVVLVRKFDGEFPENHFADALSYLDMTPDHFWRVVDRYRPPHLWESMDDGWRLRHAVWHDEHLKWAA